MASGPDAQDAARARASPGTRRPAWPWAAAVGVGVAALAGWSVWVAGGPKAPALAAASPAPAASAAPFRVAAAADPASAAAAAAPPATASLAERVAEAVPAMAEPVVDDPVALLNLAWRDEAAALAALAAWGSVAGNRPEATAANGRSEAFDCGNAGGPQCWRGRQGWPALQQADRPAVLNLQAADGSAAFVLLVGLEGGIARVVGASAGVGTAAGQPAQREAMPSRASRVPLAVLAGVWRGEFLSLWTPPPGWREAEARAAQPAAAWSGWLDAQLRRHVQAPAGAGWRDRVLAFQLAQGLPADGLPGPLTLMRLQRLSGGESQPGLGAGPAPVPAAGR